MTRDGGDGQVLFRNKGVGRSLFANDVMARRIPILDLISRTTRMFLGIVLFASAMLHLNNPYSFISDVGNYGLTGEPLSVFVAAILPFVQLVVGVALTFSFMQKGSMLLATAMFFVFAAVQGTAVWRGIDISCGCFGHLSEEVSWRSFGIVCLAFAACSFCLWHVNLSKVQADE